METFLPLRLLFLCPVSSSHLGLLLSNKNKAACIIVFNKKRDSDTVQQKYTDYSMQCNEGLLIVAESVSKWIKINHNLQIMTETD